MALTKNDIVETVHELGFTKKKSVDLIESLLEIIKSALETSEDVLISGFGKFCVKENLPFPLYPRVRPNTLPVCDAFLSILGQF